MGVAIIAAADALSAERISEEDRTVLAAAVDAEAARLSRLIDKLLDLSRLEAGQAQPHPDWCAIDEVVTAAIDELGARGERLRVAIEDGLPFVRADAAQLERAIVNLIESALRFSPNEPVLVQVHRADKQLLVLSSTAGPGFPFPSSTRYSSPSISDRGSRARRLRAGARDCPRPDRDQRRSRPRRVRSWTWRQLRDRNAGRD